MSEIKRQVFFSFHYANDSWRASIVRNIGVVEGNKIVSDNEWEEVKRGGDEVIKRWINSNMEYRSCLIVLVGSETAGRKWIDYEINHAWSKGMGVVGIYIHNLANQHGKTCKKGENPFNKFTLGSMSLSDICTCYDPSSHNTRDDIKNHLPDLIEEAIRIRNRYGK